MTKYGTLEDQSIPPTLEALESEVRGLSISDPNVETPRHNFVSDVCQLLEMRSGIQWDSLRTLKPDEVNDLCAAIESSGASMTVGELVASVRAHGRQFIHHVLQDVLGISRMQCLEALPDSKDQRWTEEIPAGTLCGGLPGAMFKLTRPLSVTFDIHENAPHFIVANTDLLLAGVQGRAIISPPEDDQINIDTAKNKAIHWMLQSLTRVIGSVYMEYGEQPIVFEGFDPQKIEGLLEKVVAPESDTGA